MMSLLSQDFLFTGGGGLLISLEEIFSQMFAMDFNSGTLKWLPIFPDQNGFP